LTASSGGNQGDAQRSSRFWEGKKIGVRKKNKLAGKGSKTEGHMKKEKGTSDQTTS